VTRTLSVRVVTNEAKLLILSREQFERTLGSISQDLMENYVGIVN
jgi:hypothetical protein